MASLGEIFSIDTLPASKEYGVFPAGFYDADIVNAELKKTKDGAGEFISIQFRITGPTSIGRILFTNINRKNKSEKCEAIGRDQLGDIMRAISLFGIRDSDELIGGKLSIKVVITPPVFGVDGAVRFPEKNEVKGFKPLQTSKPVQKPEATQEVKSKAVPW
jgi:hypothetical protein